MRILSFILIVLGIYMLIFAVHDQVSGCTTMPLVFGPTDAQHSYLFRKLVFQDKNPDLFHHFMLGHWICAFVVEIAGWILLLRTLDKV